MIDTDLGPATKVLPACERYAGKSVDILYCDDDQIYPPGWARSFIDARRYHPNEAIAVCGAHVSSLGKQYTKGLRLPRAVKMRTIYDFSYLGRRARQIFAKGLGLKVSKPRRNHFFRKSGFIDIAAGFGGVLVKPEMFDSVAFDIPSKLWTVNDIWLSGMLARKGIDIWGNSEGFLPIPHEGSSDALQFSVLEGFNRHQADLSCFEYLAREYRIWSD